MGRLVQSDPKSSRQSAPLDDGEVARDDLAFDADLVASVLGHPSGAPALH